MRYSYSFVFLIIINLAVSFSAEAAAQELIRINEFMALNNNGLDDEDRDESDWIEIYNAGTETVDLEGWYLTDDINDLRQWDFPRVTLAPDTYLIVFASGKDRRDPLAELHTNFRLRGAGEYLGLIRPDGKTVVSEFFPQYPKQAPDISYGPVGGVVERELLTAGAPAKALIPQDDSLEAVSERSEMMRRWTQEETDDSGWLTGTTGVGYDYSDLIGLDVSEMLNVNTTVYVRVPFVVEDPSKIETLTLRMRFDDGIIAYINGQEVARDNAPAPGEETWDSVALVSRPDDIAIDPVDYVIPEYDFLHVGANMLAVHGLNHRIGSSDLLIIPELVGAVDAIDGSTCNYFPSPTPGKVNNDGVDVLGPIVSDVDHNPLVPDEDEDLQIIAQVEPFSEPINNVMLYYRVMFDRELSMPMQDDGMNGDVEGGDGLYSVRIPAFRYEAGQMIRWFIVATDTAGRRTRFPSYIDPLNSPQYDGTIINDPSLTNPLEVLLNH